MKIIYQVEKATEVLEEIKPLLQSHWAEIARHKDKIALNPDYDKYLSLDSLGLLHVVTARERGILVGYFISFIAPHIHYKDHVMSVNDIIYVVPEYRKGMVSIKMLKYAERTLREKGVTKIHINVKLSYDFGKVLERIGFVAIEKIYEKMLI